MRIFFVNIPATAFFKHFAYCSFSLLLIIIAQTNQSQQSDPTKGSMDHRAQLYSSGDSFRGSSLYQGDTAKPKGQHFMFLQSKSIFKQLKGTDFRGTLGNLISATVEAVAPQSCLGQVFNTGYTNTLVDEDDYPYQPACYGQSSENSITCFPGSALALTPNGTIPMNRLTAGTRVATGIEFQNGKAVIRYDPVLFFIHNDKNARGLPWVIIEWDIPYDVCSNATGHQLKVDTDAFQKNFARGTMIVSSYHLIYASRCASTVSSNATKCGQFTFTAAKRLRVGDTIAVFPFGEQQVNKYFFSGLSTARITGLSMSAVRDSDTFKSIPRFTEGLYAPATASGTMLVDGVLASQYSTLPWVPSRLDPYLHSVIHLIMRPLFLFSSFITKQLGKGALTWTLQIENFLDGLRFYVTNAALLISSAPMCPSFSSSLPPVV